MAVNDMDGDPQAGTPSTPNGGSSDGKGDSGSSFDASALQTSIEALTKRLEEVDARSRALQGDKDRAVTKNKADVDELKRKFAEIEKMKKSGLDEDAAFEELTFRDEVRAVREGLSKLTSAQPQAAGNGKGEAVNMAQVIKNYGLDGTDPEVISVLRQEFQSPIEAENAILKIAYQKAKPNQPSPAAAPAMTGTPSNPDSVERATVEYIQKIKSARGKRQEIKSLQEEYKKKGVDIYSVDLS